MRFFRFLLLGLLISTPAWAQVGTDTSNNGASVGTPYYPGDRYYLNQGPTPGTAQVGRPYYYPYYGAYPYGAYPGGYPGPAMGSGTGGGDTNDPNYFPGTPSEGPNKDSATPPKKKSGQSNNY